MKITRNVRRIAVAAALALVAGLAAAFLARNAIAASILRSTGSRLLGVRVDVDAVDIDVFGLAVAVDGLRVANPEGWGAPTALEAGHIRLALSGDSDASTGSRSGSSATARPPTSPRSSTTSRMRPRRTARGPRDPRWASSSGG
jgi:hypothetical protein